MSTSGTAGAWEELVSAALVGTARRAAPPASLAGIAPVAPSALGGHEVAVLAAAAVLAGYRRAGRRPRPAPRELPAPAGADGRPACSEAAAGILDLLLSGEVPVPGGTDMLVAEWLAGASRAGCRAPAHLLPRLLDLGVRAASLRPLILDAGGPRARWLSRHHDGWGWVEAAEALVGIEAMPDGPVGPEAAATAGAAGAPTGGVEVGRRFAAAGRAERAEILERLRAVDPAGARRLLEGTWGKEPAADRAALVATLSTGLSADDERFLEAALDDRAAAVRSAAATLLSRLPSSRRAGRMADRLRPLVSASRGSLTVTWPDDPDLAARRDGITDAAPKGIGVRAWRLVQLVAGAPLGFWTGQLGMDPARIVRLAADTSTDLLTGLEEAVAAQGHGGAGDSADPAWAEALFSVRPSAGVLAALGPDRAATTLAGFLARTPVPNIAVPGLLAAVPGPWPPGLSEAVVDRYIHLGGRAAPEVTASLPTLAERLDPSALTLVETWAFALAGHDAFRRRVRSLGHALSLRLAIHQELP